MEQNSSRLKYVLLALLLSVVSLFAAAILMKGVEKFFNLDTVWGQYIKISVLTIFMFGIPPIILKNFCGVSFLFGRFTDLTKSQKQILRLGLLAWILCLIPVHVLSILNSLIHFPEKLADVELALRDFQQANEKFLADLISTPGTIHFLALIIVISVLPAIFEELFFRGCLQTLIINYAGKVWSSIVLTSLVFAMFHGEFFSILPRLLLGIILGMAYYGSRTLWVPALLHFVNNFVSLVSYRYFSDSIGQEIFRLVFGRYFGLGSAILLLIAVYAVLRRMREIGSN